MKYQYSFEFSWISNFKWKQEYLSGECWINICQKSYTLGLIEDANYNECGVMTIG